MRSSVLTKRQQHHSQPTDLYVRVSRNDHGFIFDADYYLVSQFLNFELCNMN